MSVAPAPDLTTPRAVAETSVDHLSPLIGESPAFTAVVSYLRRAVKVNAPIHLVGEPGTGKTLLAHHAHRWSRRPGPLVWVPCASIRDEQDEAQLFGADLPAFMAGRVDPASLIGRAQQGTLLLDRVDGLSGRARWRLVHLFNALEGQRASVGGTPLDIKIISTTTVDLRPLAQEAHTERLLVANLLVFSLRVPPLDARGGDIDLIARHLLKTRHPHPFGRVEPLDHLSLRAFCGLPGLTDLNDLQAVVCGARLAAGDDAIAEWHFARALHERRGGQTAQSDGLRGRHRAALAQVSGEVPVAPGSDLTPEEAERLMDLARRQGHLRRHDLERLGYSPRTANRRLAALVQRGAIRGRREGRATLYDVVAARPSGDDG